MRRSGWNIMMKLIGLVRPLLHVMIAAVILGIAGYLCAIFIPILGVFGILSALGLMTFSLQNLIVILLVLAVARGILRYTEQAGNHYIAFKLLALIRHKVFAVLRKLSPAKLEGKDKGNLISIITSDIELLEVFYAHTISPIAIGFLTSVIMLIFFASYHYAMTLIAAIGYLIVGVLIPLWNSAAGRKDGMRFREEFGELNSYFLDSLRGLKESIQYQNGEERLKDILEKTVSLDKLQKKLKHDEGNTRAITSITIMFSGMAALIVSAYLTGQGQLDFTAALVCTVGIISSFGPVTALSNLSNNLTQTLASGERVLSLLEEEPAVTEVMQGESIDNARLSCENVTFGYQDETILDGISVAFDRNEIVGIHGKSGSGKSTLLKLMMRFWDVNKGKVLIGKNDIRTVETSQLRDMEAYMTQATYLFHNTIRENIAIAKQDASMAEIEAAARKAAVHEFIAGLSDGYETKVAELGESLSGGEKQRIGLARAFLHQADVLLLDEPTSNLDSLNEAIILKSLKEACRDRTVVLVSHRKSTMHIAERIYKLETGRVS